MEPSFKKLKVFKVSITFNEQVKCLTLDEFIPTKVVLFLITCSFIQICMTLYTSRTHPIFLDA